MDYKSLGGAATILNSRRIRAMNTEKSRRKSRINPEFPVLIGEQVL